MDGNAEPRQLTVLNMLTLALRSYPRERTWARVVRRTCQIGGGLHPPVAASEVEALKDMTLGDLYAAIRDA
jgi:hypothetical protein